MFPLVSCAWNLVVSAPTHTHLHHKTSCIFKGFSAEAQSSFPAGPPQAPFAKILLIRPGTVEIGPGTVEIGPGTVENGPGTVETGLRTVGIVPKHNASPNFPTFTNLRGKPGSFVGIVLQREPRMSQQTESTGHQTRNRGKGEHVTSNLSFLSIVQAQTAQQSLALLKSCQLVALRLQCSHACLCFSRKAIGFGPRVGFGLKVKKVRDSRLRF